jgi:hypothetical protein
MYKLFSVLIAVLMCGLVATAQQPTAAKSTPVEVWCVGDDGLTLRLRDALEKEFSGSRMFTPGSGKKPGTLLVTIPTSVDWKVVKKRTKVLYRVEFEFANENTGPLFRNGSCWEDQMSKCAADVVHGAEDVVQRRK